MKRYYVYELINSMGSIEYVGISINPEARFQQHTKFKPSKTSTARGKFLGRQDIFMNVVIGFESITDARNLEEELQINYNLPCDRHVKKTNMRNNNYLLSMDKQELKEHQTIMVNRRWDKNKLNENVSI